MLGDDALGCLRDLKKWLRFYDEKLNRMDVARCLAETNLLRRDLLPILSLWGDSEQSDKHRSRIMLACCAYMAFLVFVSVVKVLTKGDFFLRSGIACAIDVAGRATY